MVRILSRRAMRRYGRRVNRAYKRFKRHKRRDPFKKAQRNGRRQAKQIIRSPRIRIENFRLPNIVYRKFCQFTTWTRTIAQWTTDTGKFANQYSMNYLIPQIDLDYYKARYVLGQLVSLNLTFYLKTQKGLVKITDQGGSIVNYTQQQVTDTRMFPDMYVGHFTSPHTYGAFNVAYDETKLPSSKSIQRMTASNKCMFKYNQPSGYRALYAETAGWAESTTTATALSGPENNEPYGFIWYMPHYADYSGNASVTLQIRADATFAFKDRRPDTTS